MGYELSPNGITLKTRTEQRLQRITGAGHQDMDGGVETLVLWTGRASVYWTGTSRGQVVGPAPVLRGCEYRGVSHVRLGLWERDNNGMVVLRRLLKAEYWQRLFNGFSLPE